MIFSNSLSVWKFSIQCTFYATFIFRRFQLRLSNNQWVQISLLVSSFFSNWSTWSVRSSISIFLISLYESRQFINFFEIFSTCCIRIIHVSSFVCRVYTSTLSSRSIFCCRETFANQFWSCEIVLLLRWVFSWACRAIATSFCSTSLWSNVIFCFCCNLFILRLIVVVFSCSSWFWLRFSAFVSIVFVKRFDSYSSLSVYFVVSLVFSSWFAWQQYSSSRCFRCLRVSIFNVISFRCFDVVIHQSVVLFISSNIDQSWFSNCKSLISLFDYRCKWRVSISSFLR